MNQESGILRFHSGQVRNQGKVKSIIHDSLFMIHSYGFTLVELLVVMAVTVSIGAIVFGIITSTLRGSNKTNVINNVRQNGNFAISQMGKMIPYAKSFNGASSSVGPPWICQALPPGPPPPLTHYKSIKITSFDGGVTIFSCNDSGDLPPNTIASNAASLIDADATTGSVSLPLPIPSFCFFTCTKGSIADSATIGINFTLTQKGAPTFVEKKASIQFETSIKVRNF